MVKLLFTGLVALTVLSVNFEPNKEVEVSPEAAWVIMNKYGDKGPFKVVSGPPSRPNITPRRYVGRSVADEGMRVPTARAISTLPPPVPEDVRKQLGYQNWREKLPSIIEKHDAVSTALWAALNGMADQAEAILRLVTVPE